MDNCNPFSVPLWLCEKDQAGQETPPVAFGTGELWRNRIDMI